MSSYRQDLTAQYQLDEAPLSLFESGGMRDFFIQRCIIDGRHLSMVVLELHPESLLIETNCERTQDTATIPLRGQIKHSNKSGPTAKYIDHAGPRTGS